MSLLRKWALTLVGLLPASAPQLEILWKTSGCDSADDDKAASNRSWRDFLDSVALLPPSGLFNADQISLYARI